MLKPDMAIITPEDAANRYSLGYDLDVIRNTSVLMIANTYN